MNNDTSNIFVYLKELPTEISAGFIIFIILLCLCCFKDCFWFFLGLVDTVHGGFDFLGIWQSR